MNIQELDFDMQEEKRTFSRVGAAFALLVFVTVAAQYAMLVILKALGVSLRELSGTAQIVLSVLPMYAVAVPVSVAFLKKTPGRYQPADHSWKPGWLIGCFMICVTVMYLGNIIGQVLMLIFRTVADKPMDNALTDLVMNSNLLANFLTVAVAAPIIEEFLFRKLLIDRINRYGQGVSILVSGILFGLMHGNFYQFFYAFGLGAIFAFIYVKTGRLRYTIAYHMVINFLGSVLSVWLVRFMSSPIVFDPSLMAAEDYTSMTLGMMVLGLYGLTILGCFVAGIVLLILGRKQFKAHPGLITIPKGLRFRTVFLNVGMMTFFVACLAQFAASLIL